MQHRLISLTVTVVALCQLHFNARAEVVGFLTTGTMASLNREWLAAFHRGLAESGYVDGRNVTIEYRAADNLYGRLPTLADELVARRVNVIVAAGGPASALAAKDATDKMPSSTTKIPIVFTTIADPVKSGLVESYNRPGRNITGTAGLTSELDPKRLELLYEFRPSARPIGVLTNPNRPNVDAQTKDLELAAQKINVQLDIQQAGNEQAIDTSVKLLAHKGVSGLLVTADPLFNFLRKQVLALTARHEIPAIYQWREFVVDGGLMSYGPNIAEAYYQSGLYAGRILNGTDPANLAVIQPSRFELAINLKTAKSLRMEVPPGLLARATDVVE